MAAKRNEASLYRLAETVSSSIKVDSRRRINERVDADASRNEFVGQRLQNRFSGHVVVVALGSFLASCVTLRTIGYRLVFSCCT